MTVVCIHQPDFAPWLGFFDRLRTADIFIALDDAQFLRRGWHHRDRIKTAQGVTWLTIREAEIDETDDWRGRHLETLRHAYAKAAFFTAEFPAIEAIYNRQHRLLIDLNLDLIAHIGARLCVPWAPRFASELDRPGRSTARLVDLVKTVGGTCYLTGTGARGYLDEKLFADAGISVIWQQFDTPVYPQLHGSFVPKLSALDYLLNCGGAPVSGSRS
jgi:hypothetical protein